MLRPYRDAGATILLGLTLALPSAASAQVPAGAPVPTSPSMPSSAAPQTPGSNAPVPTSSAAPGLGGTGRPGPASSVPPKPGPSAPVPSQGAAPGLGASARPGAAASPAGQTAAPPPGSAAVPGPTAGDAPNNLLAGAPGSAEPTRARTGPTLALAEVLESVERRDPRMESAELGVRSAAGQARAARGFFDPIVRGRAVLEPIHRNAILDARVEQPTPFWGLTAWAGWQGGVGRTPFYNSTLDTMLDIDDRVGGRDVRSKTGTLSAGLSLPLWRDRAIDRRRANIRQSSMEKDRMQQLRDAQLLTLEAEAAASYWTWVANGLRLEIEEMLLDLAQARDGALRRRIELGALDPLAGVDNRRLILDREGRVVAAERAFQQAGLSLSLYLRDGNGEPVIAGAERLPARLPGMSNPRADDIANEISSALERRPDRQARLILRSQADVELRWARNQRAPRVEASAWVSRYTGKPLVPDFVRNGAVMALTFEIPIPMRTARGQLEATRAAVDIVSAELRLLDNTIAVEVRDGHQALNAAYRRARLANQEVELTRQLAAAEYRKFQLGAGDLILVNFREVASADAANSEVQAVLDYFIAKAKLEVALGLGVQPVAP